LLSFYLRKAHQLTFNKKPAILKLNKLFKTIFLFHFLTNISGKFKKLWDFFICFVKKKNHVSFQSKTNCVFFSTPLLKLTFCGLQASTKTEDVSRVIYCFSFHKKFLSDIIIKSQIKTLSAHYTLRELIKVKDHFICIYFR
jgi:hypothetical protein